MAPRNNDLLIDRSNELQRLRRLLKKSKDRVVLLEGAPGSGKSTLASQFAHRYAEDFPGGIEYRAGFGYPDSSLQPNMMQGPKLLVYDGLDEVWPGTSSMLGLIRNEVAQNKNLYVLITSRPTVHTSVLDRVRLGPLTDQEVAELIGHAAGGDGTPPRRIIDLASGNALVAATIGRLASEHKNWATLIESLRSFRRPGLIDVNGRPMRADSRARRVFITDVREVNDWIMKLIHGDPDIIYQLPPRRFEEISAEVFTRLGYEVTLTPPTNDGGKDLIVVKRSDLGTMLTFVECKRYVPGHPVGVEVVRALNGVVEEGRATSGIVLTTSRFTKGARTLESKLRYRMTLKEFGDFKLLLDRALHSG